MLGFCVAASLFTMYVSVVLHVSTLAWSCQFQQPKTDVMASYFYLNLIFRSDHFVGDTDIIHLHFFIEGFLLTFEKGKGKAFLVG